MDSLRAWEIEWQVGLSLRPELDSIADKLIIYDLSVKYLLISSVDCITDSILSDIPVQSLDFVAQERMTIVQF